MRVVPWLGAKGDALNRDIGTRDTMLNGNGSIDPSLIFQFLDKSASNQFNRAIRKLLVLTHYPTRFTQSFSTLYSCFICT